MKTAAKEIFRIMIVTGILFSAGTAIGASQQIIPMNGAWEHCGCDTKEGIQMFVGNLVNEAQQRGAVYEAANTHIPACIAVWCSTCAGHPGAVENCITTANEYLAEATKACNQRPSELFTALQNIPNYQL